MPSNENGLTRTEQKQLTRRRLLEATIDIIAEEGLTGVTMGRVAERTDLSRGICNFHFNTKDQLLIEALRMLYHENEQAWRGAIADPKLSPEKKLKKLIETLLNTPVADPKKLAVWFAFWGIPTYRKKYIELCAQGDRAYEGAIENLLLEMSGGLTEIKGLSLRAISVALTGMIDGVHLQYLIAPGRLDENEATQACLAYLSSFFPVA
ncbi:MAG: TetR/AcrR family transcriptional regulator [Candidatus Thiodiazotropha sp.]